LAGEPKYSEKTCPSANLSTTKSHMTTPGLEPRTAAVGCKGIVYRLKFQFLDGGGSVWSRNAWRRRTPLDRSR
jgi:hypothetical protein